VRRREIQTPRPDYREKIERYGLSFHTLRGRLYWYESAAYRLDPAEVTVLQAATNELQERCLEAVEEVISRDWFDRLGVPLGAQGLIREVWELDPPAIYGRFDLCHNGEAPPKLLEYHADTPTSLLEAAVVQWHWLQDVDPAADQFNSVWEGLVEKWRDLNGGGTTVEQG